MLRQILLFIICAFSTFATIAQSFVSVYMNHGGAFQFENGSNYTVLNFEGKSDKELYDEMMMNILYLYIQPNDVVCGVDGKMIKVRGHMSNIGFIKDGTSYTGNAYYQIYFYIKNGKVKILAPIFENIRYARISEIKPSELATLYIQSADQSDLIKIQNNLNSTLNYILGLEASSSYPYLNDW